MRQCQRLMSANVAPCPHGLFGMDNVQCGPWTRLQEHGAQQMRLAQAFLYLRDAMVDPAYVPSRHPSTREYLPLSVFGQVEDCLVMDYLREQAAAV